MVLYLKSEQDGLEISFMNYSITILDRCVELHFKVKYKNTSSLPMTLKFDNDSRDLGTLFYLESVDHSSQSKIYSLFDVSELTDNNNLKNSSLVVDQISELVAHNYNRSIFTKKLFQNSTGNGEIELLPDKEISLFAKYFRVIDYKQMSIKRSNSSSNSSFDDNSSELIDSTSIRFEIPTSQQKQSLPQIQSQVTTVDVQFECEFSLPFRSITCESHPSLVAGTFTMDTITKAVFHVGANRVMNEDLLFNIQLNNGYETFTGWYSTVSLNHQSDGNSSSSLNTSNDSSSLRSLLTSSQPPYVMSRVVSVHNDSIHDLKADWSNCGDDKLTMNYSNINQGFIISSLVEFDDLSQYRSSHNLGSISNSSNNVLLKYSSSNNNNQNEFNLPLKKAKLPSLLNRYISLHKLKSFNIELEPIHLSTLLKLFFNIPYQELINLNKISKLSNSNGTSPLSQSAPETNNSNNNIIITNTDSPPIGGGGEKINNNNTSTTTTTLLPSFKSNDNSGSSTISNFVSNLPKRNPLGGITQSFTAPPSVMNKDMSNPIADFIANKQSLGSSTTPTKSKKGPPPKLGGQQAGITSDIRLQRLASYTKVNQMWNLTLQDLAERSTISLRELEPFAFDFALSHIRTTWWKPNRTATKEEIQLLRTIISEIIHSSRIEITFVNTILQSKTNGSSTSTSSPPPVIQPSLSSGFQDLSKLLSNPPTPTPPPSSSNNNIIEPEKTIREVDPTKLKWIIENVLDSEKDKFNQLTTSSENDNSWYSVSAFEGKGNRPHMEDRHTIIEYPDVLYGLTKSINNNNSSSNSNDNNQVFFGVFDGHNGKVAAEFSKVNLPYEIYSAGGCLEESTKKGYNQTDKYFLEYADREDKKAGTTVATVILERKEFYLANVGDTEVILSVNGVATPITTKHNPMNESEKDRVESLGGSIIFYGTLRVNGVLSVTRSIGDKHLKEYVSSDPAYLYHKIEKQDQFFVMATDGLWEVFTYQEVVDFILTGKFNISPPVSSSSNNSNSSELSSSTGEKIENNSSNSSNQNTCNINENNNNNNNNNNEGGKCNTSISEQLIEEAIRRNSKDNITVIIVFLRDNYTPIR